MEKNINIFAEVLEDEALNQFYKAMSLPCNVAGALMPDAHAGYTLPIGSVIKSKDMIFPSYVGYDIGCGMSAIRTSIKDFKTEQLEVLKLEILSRIPVGAERHANKKRYPNEYNPIAKFAQTAFRDVGVYQLGTLGGGNHFIELGQDREGFINIIIHSGSRNVGKVIAEEYMKLAAIKNTDEERYAQEFDAKNSGWMHHNPEGYERAKKEFIYRRVRARLSTNTEGHFGFDINSKEGQEYLNDMNQALNFALDNREEMIKNVLLSMEAVFGKVSTDRFINRNHNHAELKDGFVIHRKGATHAEKGMMGVIPGNMKDGCFIVEGLGNEASICSSSHGAGRVLSRNQARAQLDIQEFHELMRGVVTNHTDSTLDESPRAYKDIFEVMELQRELVNTIDYVKPILNIKG